MTALQQTLSAPARACFAALDAALPEDWRVLAAQWAAAWAATGVPRRVALSGGQGAGKTTLAGAVVAAAGHFGIKAVALSLDDFYLTRAERIGLGQTVHPLCVTRGPPGSHDVALCEATLARLFQPGTASIPMFDKGRDDRSPTPRAVATPVDLALIEGWCVGARPEPAARLVTPINALEANEDASGVWRRRVNASLAGAYAGLFASFDQLIYLRVPDMAAVRRWRLLAERERPPAQRLRAAAIERFVAHYERLTVWMREELPTRADVVVQLDGQHRVAEVSPRTGG